MSVNRTVASTNSASDDSPASPSGTTERNLSSSANNGSLIAERRRGVAETPRPDLYQDGETFGLSVFLRDGDNVFRTYFTTARGVEVLGSVWTFLDLTPLGRQEEWEDSPAGYPQTRPYEWWRRHDEYADA